LAFRLRGFGAPAARRRAGSDVRRQQPDGGGDTPGVAAAPVALAGAIVPGGVVRFIVMLSAQADVFGVGITPVAGSMLVSASTATVG